MHAIRHHAFGGPEVLAWEELPTPVPGPDEVLLRVHAAAINHYDILSRGGISPALPLPRIVGIDCTGFVERYDGPRSDLVPGTPVVVLGERLGNGGPGAYATHVCVHEEEVFPLPAGADLVAAACLGISYITAYYALFVRHRIRPGETLLIPGVGGGVASAALQLARGAGIRTFATTSAPGKCRRAEELGAEACFDYRATDVVAAVRDATGGVDVVLDAVGGASIAQGLACLRDRGRLLTIGTAYGRDFRFDGFDFLCRELEIIGVNVTPNTPAERHGMMLALVERMRQGTLEVLIDREMPIARAAEAHRLVEAHTHFGKVVLRP